MKAFIDRFSASVKGVLTGFDRIVFKGFILPLMSASEVMSFLRSGGILNKEYKNWMVARTKDVVGTADQYARDNSGQPVVHIPAWRIRKEELAHERQQKEQIKAGLIGAWSCLERGSSYRAVYCKEAGFPQLRNYQTQCRHLYFYFDDSEFGFMSIRLQTWFPYNIQICLNGREWLRRGLEKEGVDFDAHGNKFLHIADYQRAQQLLDEQLNTRFMDMLDGFAQRIFPGMENILGPHLSYYWTLWQSEWAADLIFDSSASLQAPVNTLLRHAHIIGTSTRVLRYLDRPLTKTNRPDARSNDTVVTRITDFNDGIRIRHRVDKNSVRLYNERNNIRAETTIDDPGKFKVFRHKQGQGGNESKQRLPMRKGVMDTPLRAAVSRDVNKRFMDDLATSEEKTPICSMPDGLTVHIMKNGRRFRALDPVGKDRDLLPALSDPAYMVSRINKQDASRSLVRYSFRLRSDGQTIIGQNKSSSTIAKKSRYYPKTSQAEPISGDYQGDEVGKCSERVAGSIH